MFNSGRDSNARAKKKVAKRKDRGARASRANFSENGVSRLGDIGLASDGAYGLMAGSHAAPSDKRLRDRYLPLLSLSLSLYIIYTHVYAYTRQRFMRGQMPRPAMRYFYCGWKSRRSFATAIKRWPFSHFSTLKLQFGADVEPSCKHAQHHVILTARCF